MRNAIILLIASLLLYTCGCSEDTCNVCPRELTDVEREDIVRANCVKLSMAADEFSRQNEGIYAWNIDTDTTLTGKTIMDLMPDDGYLLNPFTGEYTEPAADEDMARRPGEVGYRPYTHVDPVAYLITACGSQPDSFIVVIVSSPMW